MKICKLFNIPTKTCELEFIRHEKIVTRFGFVKTFTFQKCLICCKVFQRRFSLSRIISFDYNSNINTIFCNHKFMNGMKDAELNKPYPLDHTPLYVMGRHFYAEYNKISSLDNFRKFYREHAHFYGRGIY